MNPYYFIPNDYEVDILEQYANRVHNLLGFCGRKSVKYVDNDNILDFSPNSQGCKSFVLSNYYTDRLSNPDAGYNNHSNIDYANISLPTGHLNEF